ncbi:hypothetical protein [Microbacterium sp. 2FI]|uniref:hypothetical protein n=1 Tax=Microbacterium sp. 2FI TaxID=2502193 RepID=UPI0010F9863D|nr:hypothetical protein [Microbacterium sp. 2FI]
MTRPVDWSPVNRAHDPIPGDPDRVSATGRLYVGTADAILRAAANIETALREGFGQSEAIDAIRDQAEDVARRIRRAEERYRGVGDAMMAYEPVLRDTQSRSVAALGAAIAAQSGRETAARMIDYYQGRIDDPATPPANLPGFQAQLSTWTTKAAGAQSGLTTAEADIDAAIVDRDVAADAAADAIELVENSGDLNDSRWDNFSQWVGEHKDLLETISTVLGAIAAVAGAILLFIPGINLVVGIILTVIVLANIAYQALNAVAQVSTGNMTLAEGIVNVGLAVLNVVGAAVALKVAATATKTTVATSLMRSFAGRGISGMTRARALGLVERAGVAASGPLATPLSVKVASQAIGFSTQKLSMVHAMAHGQMLSGALATGAMRPLYLATAATAGLGTATNIAEDPLSKVLEPHVPDISWRVGGDW